MTKTVWIDLDDVLCNTMQTLLNHHWWKIRWVPLAYQEVTDYLMQDLKNLKLDFQEFLDIYCWFGLSDGFWQIKPCDWAVDFVNSLYQNWYKIHIITWRDERRIDRTNERVQKFYPQVECDNIHFCWVFGKNPIPKSQVIKNLDLQFFVDDLPLFCNELCQNLDIPIYLLDKPWNRNSDLHPQIKRINSFDEIIIS